MMEESVKRGQELVAGLILGGLHFVIWDRCQTKLNRVSAASAGGLSNNTHLNMVVHLLQLTHETSQPRLQNRHRSLPSPLQLNSSGPFLHQPSHTRHHSSACPFPCFTSTSSFSPFPNSSSLNSRSNSCEPCIPIILPALEPGCATWRYI